MDGLYFNPSLKWMDTCSWFFLQKQLTASRSMCAKVPEATTRAYGRLAPGGEKKSNCKCSTLMDLPRLLENFSLWHSLTHLSMFTVWFFRFRGHCTRCSTLNVGSVGQTSSQPTTHTHTTIVRSFSILRMYGVCIILISSFVSYQLRTRSLTL